MPKHYHCEGCAHLANPIDSPGFKEYCLDCRIADVEAAINSLSPYGMDIRYIRTNYLANKAGEK